MSVLSHQFAVNPTLNFWDSVGDTTNSTLIQYTSNPTGGAFSNTTPIVLNSTSFTATFAGRICVIGSSTFTATSADNQLMVVTLAKTNAPLVSAVGQATIFAQTNESVSAFLTFPVAIGDTVSLSFSVTGALNARYANPNWVVYYVDAP